MPRHIDQGAKGEALARQYLEDKGYQVVETNWRYRRSEVDIIVRRDQWLVFVEVKTRASADFGRPEDFVTPAKEKRLAQAAFAYLAETGHQGEVRFDVISVLAPPDGLVEITHLEDAFFPGL